MVDVCIVGCNMWITELLAKKIVKIRVQLHYLWNSFLT